MAFWNRGHIYRIDVLRGTPRDRVAIVDALMAVGLTVFEKRHRLVIEIPRTSERARLPLPRSNRLGDAVAFELQTPSQRLAQAALQGLARILGPLRYTDPTFGEILVQPNRD